MSIAARYGHYSITSILLQNCDPEFIHRATRAEIQGMHGAFLALKFPEKGFLECGMSTSLLYPGEVRYCALIETPSELQALKPVNENDHHVIARYNSNLHAYLRSMYEALFGKVVQTYYPIWEFHLPIHFATHILILKSMIYVSLQLDKSDIFDNEVVQTIIDASWESYGRSYHMWVTSLYLLFIAVITLLNFTYYAWSQDLGAYNYASWTLLAVALFLNSWFSCVLFFQMVQCIYEEGLSEYFKDWMTVVTNWSAHALAYIALILRCVYQEETYESASIMSVATCLLFLRGLYFLRPFQATGPLVRMVSMDMLISAISSFKR